ncbi:MAG: hypothetical protein H6765_05210 [Candidatus Peribacteria bacterium]|nr:MAG: hypothetical protein H6765_05210 [Candidatus Peribacteria bacterium]
MTTTKPKTFGFLKLYYTIVSIAGIVGMIISFAIALTQWFNSFLVSDTEFMAGNNLFYELQNCENQMPVIDDTTSKKTTNTENPEKRKLEISLCQQEITTRMLDQRDYTTKTTIIG